MTKTESTAFAETLTQEAPVGREVEVGKDATPRQVVTGSYSAVGSVPSGMPETLEGGEEGYVFRIGGALAKASVTITINTERLIERAKVRKLNKRIRRAHRR